jgi:hypothetical protein
MTPAGVPRLGADAAAKLSSVFVEPDGTLATVIAGEQWAVIAEAAWRPRHPECLSISIWEYRDKLPLAGLQAEQPRIARSDAREGLQPVSERAGPVQVVDVDAGQRL